MKCDILVIQLTNMRIESLPLKTGRSTTKSRDNPLQRDEDPEFWSTAVPNEGEGSVIVFLQNTWAQNVDQVFTRPRRRRVREVLQAQVATTSTS